MKHIYKNRFAHFLFLLSSCVLIVSCSEKRAQMVLTFSPQDANVTIDGYRPASLNSPHTFYFYKPGSYTLEVTAPGYTPVKMKVSVEMGEVLSQTVHLVEENRSDETPNVIAVSSDTGTAESTQPSQPAAPSKGDDTFQLSVTSEPPGATVSAQSSDKKSNLVFQTPAVRSLQRGQPWFLSISLDGYSPVERTVVAPAGDAGVHLGVTLEQVNSGVASTGKPPAIGPLQQGNDSVTAPPLIVRPPVKPPSQTLLTVQTTPATVVSLDGKVIGTTPVMAHEVTPGLHKILMENRDLGKRKVINKRFTAGEHVRITQYLDAPPE